MVELKGSLGGIGLPAVLQLIGEVHHSGNLDLHKDGNSGTLAFDDGRLVAAEFGHHHGLQAVADCVLQLADGEFTFVEGIPSLDRTLDLGGSSLTKLLDRITSGEFQSLANNASIAEEHQHESDTTCPLLGFADDRSRHYSRSTALHRCFAGGAPSLVSAQDQRELCLSGQFASCPRYRNAGAAESTVRTRPLESVGPSEAPTLIAAPPPRMAAASPGAPPLPEPTRTAPPPEVPPGVAARLAATSNMRMVPDPEATTVEPPRPAAAGEELPDKPSRAIMPIVGGAVLGFLLVGLLMLVILPLLRPSPAPQPGVAFEQLSQPTLVAPRAVATQPIPTPASRPTLAPTPTIVVAQAKPTAAQARATVVSPSSTQSLMDVRFAAGPIARWLDNSPYAEWSDGAYRLRARDAARFVAVGVPLDETLSDVIVSATFRKTGGPPGGGYGLIVRDQGPEPRDGVNQQMTAYVFETGDLGEYGVWRRDGDHWIDLVPWMRSTSVRSGGSPNELSVRALGDQLTFIVNGAEVANITDDTLADGGIGLFVGGDNNEVALDHFSVQSPSPKQ